MASSKARRNAAVSHGYRRNHSVSSGPHTSISPAPRTGLGMHAGLNGPFVILEYDAEASLVWFENKLVSMFLEEDDSNRDICPNLDDLTKLALSPQESVDLLRELAG
jgi:uncharacterized protein DUF5753